MKPHAFVLMPFGGEFDNIYTHFISPALSEAGYNVTRADDLMNQQSILKDIVESIARCDLIVVDLSDSNPNVYYELGIAHTLSKKVILLSQNIGEVPFDIRSYRVIKYSTHFSDIIQTRAQLTELTKNTLDGKTSFGNPVTDFLNINVFNATTNSTDTNDDELGFFDHVSIFTTTLEGMGVILKNITDKSTQFAESSAEIQNNSFKKEEFDIMKEVTTMQKLATHLDNYASFIENKNDEYSMLMTNMGNSLEKMLTMFRDQKITAQETRQNFGNNIQEAIVGIDSFSETIHSILAFLSSMPNLEKNHNRARAYACRAIEKLHNNIQETKAIFTRASHLL